MSEAGGYIWFVGLGAGLLILAIAMAYAKLRRQRAGGDPNAAWRQAAAESHDESIAKAPPPSP